MSEHSTAAAINEAATHVDRLRQRRDWLTERIEAKKRVGWDIEYDTAERDALSWVLAARRGGAAVNVKRKNAERKYVLLKCMEFFRDELYLGASDSERLQEKYLELRSMCADALGNPSVADLDEIEERFKQETA